MTTKTKDAKCVGCGDDIKISLFQSVAKAKCESCKKPAGPNIGADGTYEVGIGPRIDGLPNEALQRLGCPYHPKVPMSIVGVIKSSMGDIVSLQCREPDCWTLVRISEQHRSAVRSSASGIEFEPDEILNRWPRVDPEEENGNERQENEEV